MIFKGPLRPSVESRRDGSQVGLFSVRHQRLVAAAALRLRVWAAFFADAERSANERDAAAAPPLWPPSFAEALLTF